MPSYKSKKLYVFENNKMILVEKTLEETLSDFLPLLKAMTAKVCNITNYTESREDILQTANLELIKIYDRYDHTKNVSFNHFAKMILYKQMYYTALNKANKSIVTTELNNHNEVDNHYDMFDCIDTMLDLKQCVNGISLKKKKS